MPKWNVQRDGAQWLMDSDGRVVGVRDKRQRDWLFQQAQAPGSVESLPDPAFLTPLVRDLRVATFGDSTASVGDLDVTDATAQAVCAQAIPASGVTTKGYVADKWLLPFFYPAARLVAIGGISGQTTTQMLARDAGAVSATRRGIFDVLNERPDLVVLRAGSINDISSFTTLTSQAAIDAVYARHMEIVDRFTSQGVRVLDVGMFGYDATSGTPPAAADLAVVRAALIQLNARYRDAALSRPLVRFLDTAGLTHDGTGKFLTGATDSNDGTHLSAGHNYVLAQAEAQAIESWFGPCERDIPAGSNLLGSAALLHTKTLGAFGNQQTGLTWTASAATRQNADIGFINGKLWSWCEGVPTAVDPTLTMYPAATLYGGSPGIALTQGSDYQLMVDVFMESLDGQPLGAGAYFATRMTLYNATNAGRLIVEQNTAKSGVAQASRLEGKLVLPRFRAPESSANLGTSTSFYIAFVGPKDGKRAFRAGFSNPRFVQVS